MATLFQLSWKAQETAVEQLAFAAEAATAEAAFIVNHYYLHIVEHDPKFS